jgi:diguanylate cyclase (GGDEF)-like protein
MPDHAFQVSALTVAPRTSADAGSLPAAGLPKCEALGPIVDRQLAVCRRNGTPLAVIVIRLDGIESIEPQYRHAVENQLLYAAWNRVRGRLRATDLSVRIGAAEFGVILPDAAGPTAAIVDARLIDALSQPYGFGALDIVISARAGVAVYPQSGTTGEALANTAHQVMLTRATRRQAN